MTKAAEHRQPKGMKTMKSVAIVGAGGFGREVLTLLRSLDPLETSLRFAGFVSRDRPDPDLLRRANAQWLGDDESFLTAPTADAYVVGIADPLRRQELARLFDESGLEAISLIHPTASIGFDVEIGLGTVVCAGSVVTTNVRVGTHVHLDRLVNVGHDCVIDSFVTAHPGAIISGGVHLKERSTIGAGACILPGRRISADAIVGAGAVVTRDVADSVTVVGVPAEPLHKDSPPGIGVPPRN